MVLGTMVAIVRQHDSPICGGVKGKTTRNCGGIAVRYSLILAYICHIAALRKAQPEGGARGRIRSEEHTSELQSHSDLVCRLLLEKKKKKTVKIKKRMYNQTETH